MKFPADFYQYMRTHTRTGIKGGRERNTFLEIWMVEVDGRVFARSWDKSARSWFTAFIDTGVGEIQYGEKVVRVTGKKLIDEPQTTELINEAYLQKYDQPENRFYSEGITQPEYADYTMEFFYEAAEG